VGGGGGGQVERGLQKDLAGRRRGLALGIDDGVGEVVGDALPRRQRVERRHAARVVKDLAVDYRDGGAALADGGDGRERQAGVDVGVAVVGQQGGGVGLRRGAGADVQRREGRVGHVVGGRRGVVGAADDDLDGGGAALAGAVGGRVTEAVDDDLAGRKALEAGTGRVGETAVGV